MSEERTAWGWGSGQRRRRRHHPGRLVPRTESRVRHRPRPIARTTISVLWLTMRPTRRGIRRVPVFVVSQLDEPISNAADAYLKLHLMSMRMAKPNAPNLDGIFAQLANVVWTNYGPFAVEDFTLRRPTSNAPPPKPLLAFASQAGLPAAAPAATVNVFGAE